MNAISKIRRDVRQAFYDVGVDYDNVLNRVMGKEELLWKLLYKFDETQGINFIHLQSFVQSGDLEKAKMTAHAIRGVCANLDMKSILELLEGYKMTWSDGSEDDKNERFKLLYSKYVDIVTVIRKYSSRHEK